MPFKYIIYGVKKRIPQGVATRELFDSVEDAQAFIDENPRYSRYLRSEHIKLKIEKYYSNQCNGCGKDLLPEDRIWTIHLGVTNYTGITLIDDDFDKIYCLDCGDKLQVVEPEQTRSPVRMVHGQVCLDCKAMPCYTPNKLHGYCMMNGCDAIHNTIDRFGPIVGMQIVTEAVRRYEPEYDMEYLLQDVAKEIVGTI